MARKREGMRFFQAQAFPSWQSDGAFGRGAQSEAALAACARRPKAEVCRTDGKAVVRDGMLVSGGADVR
jgi:hypothetical protein